jgi:starch synthase
LNPKTDSNFSVIHKWEFNFLKTAICSADRINTVSEKYHDELLQSNFGDGLDSAFKERDLKGSFTGILNGIDKDEFNPQKDIHLKEYNLNFDDVPGAIRAKITLRTKDFWKQFWLDQIVNTAAGKPDIFKIVKYLDPHWVDAIKQSSRISEDPKVPILGAVTRIDYQKTPILLDALQRIMTKPDCGFQFILMGTDGGDDKGKKYTGELNELCRKHPDNFLFFNIFDLKLSHYLYALFDIHIVPSIWEPCGLNQMYSVKYGAPAIVRKTGGLAESIEEGKTGFHFIEEKAYSNDDGRANIPEAAELLAATIYKAAALKKTNPAQWEKMMEAGMNSDFSWDKPIEKYLDIYRELEK